MARHLTRLLLLSICCHCCTHKHRLRAFEESPPSSYKKCRQPFYSSNDSSLGATVKCTSLCLFLFIDRKKNNPRKELYGWFNEFSNCSWSLFMLHSRNLLFSMFFHFVFHFAPLNWWFHVFFFRNFTGKKFLTSL